MSSGQVSKSALLRCLTLRLPSAAAELQHQAASCRSLQQEGMGLVRSLTTGPSQACKQAAAVWRCSSSPLGLKSLQPMHSSSPALLAASRQASSTTSAAQSAAQRITAAVPAQLSRVVSLHATALWQTHRYKVYGVLGLFCVYLVWKATFKMAGTFVNLTETLAEWGLIGLAITLVAAAAQYTVWRVTINPASVYRAAMLKLNSSPAVLEVLGAPLKGSDLRASVLMGGGLYVSRKSYKPKIRSRRVLMLFPVTGSERSALVSLEAKKKAGQLSWKLLAVDVRHDATTPASPSAARIFVEGSGKTYNRGTILDELRTPFLKAVSTQPELDKEEEVDDETDNKAGTTTSLLSSTVTWVKSMLQSPPKPETLKGDASSSNQAAAQVAASAAATSAAAAKAGTVEGKQKAT